jgi:hypothetical protein
LEVRNVLKVVVVLAGEMVQEEMVYSRWLELTHGWRQWQLHAHSGKFGQVASLRGDGKDSQAWGLRQWWSWKQLSGIS